MERHTNPDCKPEMEELMKDCPRSRSGAECWLRLCDIEGILGDEYDLERLRELVELYKNVPHICDYCIGCEIEPTDGHGCDGYDNFVFSVRRIVAALKAREQE